MSFVYKLAVLALLFLGCGCISKKNVMEYGYLPQKQKIIGFAKQDIEKNCGIPPYKTDDTWYYTKITIDEDSAAINKRYSAKTLAVHFDNSGKATNFEEVMVVGKDPAKIVSNSGADQKLKLSESIKESIKHLTPTL